MFVANVNIPISEFMDLKKKLAELQAEIELNHEIIRGINEKRMSKSINVDTRMSTISNGVILNTASSIILTTQTQDSTNQTLTNIISMRILKLMTHHLKVKMNNPEWTKMKP